MAQKDILTSGIEMSDVIACTGFPVPEDMKGKTFAECTSGGADIEANKEETIDVSAYTAPVEITPSEGKDGMAKATVTLNNIPSGGITKLYMWTSTNNRIALSNKRNVSIGDTVVTSNSNGQLVDLGEITGTGTNTFHADTYTVDFTFSYEVYIPNAWLS